MLQTVATNAGIALLCHVCSPMEHAYVVAVKWDGKDPTALREVGVIQTLSLVTRYKYMYIWQMYMYFFSLEFCCVNALLHTEGTNLGVLALGKRDPI